MNTLSYKLLVDKSVKRKVQMLQLLLEATTPISLKSFSEICQVSFKTIQQDTAILLEHLPESLRFIEYNHTLSLERYGSNRKIIAFIDELVAGNPLFHIIEDIFYGRKKDLLTHALELYLSESTIKKHLIVLKNVLMDYELDLDFQAVKIIGDERNIRYFFFQYFRYIHESSAPQIAVANYQVISNTLHTLKTNYGLDLNFDYYRSMLWLFIMENRIQQRHYAQFEPTILEKYAKKESFIKYQQAIQALEIFNLSDEQVKRNELMFVYFSQLDTIIYESNRSYLTNDFLVEYAEQEELIHQFFLQSKQNMALNHQAKTALQAYLVNLTLLSECTTLFQKYPQILCQKAKTQYPDTYHVWETLLQRDGQFLYLKEIASRLTLLYEVKKYNQIRVLFALTGDSSSVSYFKAQAEKVLPRQAEPSFLFNQPLSDEVLLHLQVDICVYNFEPQQSLTATNLYRLSDIPLDIEWQELQAFLDTFRFKL